LFPADQGSWRNVVNSQQRMGVEPQPKFNPVLFLITQYGIWWRHFWNLSEYRLVTFMCSHSSPEIHSCTFHEILQLTLSNSTLCTIFSWKSCTLRSYHMLNTN